MMSALGHKRTFRSASQQSGGTKKLNLVMRRAASLAMADFKPLNIYGHRTYAMKPAAKITTMTGRNPAWKLLEYATLSKNAPA
jgi:hypothetical protein